jgi:hypothetical protein
LDLAGSVAGVIFSSKAFVWSVLLSYIVLLLVGPAGGWTTLGLSLWVGVAADWAAEKKERGRRLA